MKALSILRSPRASLLLFVAMLVACGYVVVRARAQRSETSGQMTEIPSALVAPLRDTISRKGAVFRVPSPAAHPVAAIVPPAGAVAQHESKGRELGSTATNVRHPVLPISLLSSPRPAAAAAPRSVYAPYGRLIPCETVVTLESSHLDTPVIGLVTENVWHAGELVIPAGTEVHGRAALDHDRERISAAGKWVLVWRDGGRLNGSELVVSGIALDRSRDDATGEFGLRDGSAGLLGTVIKSDNQQELKLFASTFLAGVSSGLEQNEPGLTPSGLVVPVPVASLKNAALHGTADVLNDYARQIGEAIRRDGVFVRVPAGKQFYLYITETIEQAKGLRNNAANAEIWSKNNE